MGVYTQSRSVPSESTVDNSAVYEVILNEFLANDIKIVIGLFDMETAIKLFCEVYKKNMYGKNYQWIIMGSYDKSFFTTLNTSTSNHLLNNCSINQIVTALNGTLQTRVVEYSHSLERITEKSEFTKVVDGYFRWLKSNKNYLIPNACQSINEYFHGYAFDVLISIYKVLGSLIETGRFTCDRDSFERTKDWFTLLNKAFGQVSFNGVTVSLVIYSF